jgi:hypothetical protein
MLVRVAPRWGPFGCLARFIHPTLLKNAATKKDPYPLPFIDEVLNIIVGYETYPFLDGYSGYHQISIALEDKYKTAFVIDWVLLYGR